MKYLYCPMFYRLAVTTLLMIAVTGVWAQQPGRSPIKIFILAGQSNMQGHGEMDPVGTMGTLEYLVANDPNEDYQFLVDGGGDWKVWDDVWIHYERAPSTLLTGDLTTGYGTRDDLIGPEVGFGHVVGQYYENQVLLVKAAWGGKSLAVDFRPPSSGGTVGFYYNEILRLYGDATNNLSTYFPDYDGQGYELVGLGWHQGWNDRVNQGFNDQYETNMANFIRDIRGDLGVEDLPFVIATTGMSGWDETHPRALSLMEAQLAVAQYPEFQGNVFTVETRPFFRPSEQSPSSQAFHWNRNAETYMLIGLSMGEAMTALVVDPCPSDLSATGGTGGVELRWTNGDELPTSVRVLREGQELASAAPVTPPSFLDAGAEPGLINYELIFTKPGEPCDSLTLAFDGCVTDLEMTRSGDGVALNWKNNMSYTGFEIRRNGVLLEGSLPGGSDSYLDATPPAGGIATYTVVPLNGSCDPTAIEIDLDLPLPGTALIYEPFDYAAGGLDGKGGTSDIGFDGAWLANEAIVVADGTLTYGDLPVAGGKISDLGSGQGFGGSRTITTTSLADSGLLEDGAELWFSLIAGTQTEAELFRLRLWFALASDPFSSGDISWALSAGEGIGVELSRGVPGVSFWVPNQVRAGSTAAVYAPGAHGLLVGRIVWGASDTDDDTIELYQPDTELNLGPVVSSGQRVLDQSTFDTITFRRGDQPVLDEIRFGESYEAVIGGGFPEVPLMVTIVSDGSGFSLQWPSEVGKLYNVWSTSDVTASPLSWVALETNIVATPDVNTLNVSPLGPTQFYMIEEFAAPAAP